MKEQILSLNNNFSIKDLNGIVVCQLSRTNKYSGAIQDSWMNGISSILYIYNITQLCYPKRFTRIIWVPASLTFTLKLVREYFPYTNKKVVTVLLSIRI